MISHNPESGGPITGNQVRALRTAWNLRVSDLAQLMGVAPNSVYRYERTGDEPVQFNDALWWQILAGLDAAKYRAELQNVLVLGRARALHFLLTLALAPK